MRYQTLSGSGPSRARRGPLILTCIALAALGTASGCSIKPARPFTVSGTGGLDGIVFLDRDQNGLYDPSAGDSAMANVHLIVQVRGTSAALAGGDVHSGVDGRFDVSDLPAGTHWLRVDTTGMGSVVSFCENPKSVSIYISETQFVTLDGRTGCVITIAAAEQQSLGARITVRGTVTSTVNQISTGQAYIEDETGGVELFSPTGPSFQIGDVIEVSATLAAFNNEFELSPVTVNSVQSGTPLAPADVTSKDAADAGSDIHANLQGRLIRIKAGKLLDVFTTGGGRNAVVDDGSGAVAVRFDSHVVADTTTLKTTFTAGKCYDWTGILKAFTNPPVELFPRSLSEATEVACP